METYLTYTLNRASRQKDTSKIITLGPFAYVLSWAIDRTEFDYRYSEPKAWNAWCHLSCGHDIWPIQHGIQLVVCQIAMLCWQGSVFCNAPQEGFLKWTLIISGSYMTASYFGAFDGCMSGASANLESGATFVVRNLQCRLRSCLYWLNLCRTLRYQVLGPLDREIL